MAIGRRTVLAAAMASVAAPALLRVARGDAPQFIFKLHHALSSVSGGHDKFLAPWARTVEAQAQGRIRIDIFPAMQLGGQPAQLYDQARDGVADIVFAAPSLTPGRFPRIETFELPFVPARRALVSSRAMQDFAAEHLKDEFAEVQPICFCCADAGIVHTNHPVETIADVKGLKLHIETRFAGEAVRALGAHAVPMPSAQLPLAISRHVIDGCIDPWHMVPSVKLDDLLKAHTDFADVSLSTTTFVLAMNNSAYGRLPPDLKTIIDSNSGQVAAGMAGAMWDLQAAAVADRVSQRGDAIITLMPEAVAHWREATRPVIEAWLKQMKRRKIDGDRLLASARSLIDKYADRSEPQPPQRPQLPESSQPAQTPQPPQSAQPSSVPQPAQAKADIGASPKPDAQVAAPSSAIAKPAVTTPAMTPSATAAPPGPVANPAAPPAPAPVVNPTAAAAQAIPVGKPVVPPAPLPAPAAPAAVSPAKSLNIPL